MAKIHISDVLDGVDGVYDFDLKRPFTNRELHVIKEVSGVRVGELDDAIKAEDSDLYVAFAMIVTARAGKDVPADLFWDAPGGSIKIDYTEEIAAQKAEDEAKKRGDAGPPDGKPESDGPKNSENNEPSGSDSTNDGDHQENTPPDTGTPVLDTGATSDPPTSET